MLHLRSWLGLAVIAVLGAVLQTALLPMIELGGVKPDLLMALVVFLSLRARWQDVFVANWAMGMLKDVYSAAPLGTFGLLFLLVGLLVGLASQHLFSEHPMVHIAVAFVAAALCDGIAALLLVLIRDLPSAEPLVRRALWGAGYTAVIMPILAWVMIRPARWLRLPARTHAGV